VSTFLSADPGPGLPFGGDRLFEWGWRVVGLWDCVPRVCGGGGSCAGGGVPLGAVPLLCPGVGRCLSGGVNIIILSTVVRNTAHAPPCGWAERWGGGGRWRCECGVLPVALCLHRLSHVFVFACVYMWQLSARTRPRRLTTPHIVSIKNHTHTHYTTFLRAWLLPLFKACVTLVCRA